jgi:CpXC protein
MRGYRFRVVRTSNDLIEKILIFDSGYDDRILEFVKLMLLAETAETSKCLGGELLVDGIEEANDAEQICFAHVRETGTESLSIPVASYRQVEESLAKVLPTADDEWAKWMRVDRQYGLFLAERFGKT